MKQNSFMIKSIDQRRKFDSIQYEPRLFKDRRKTFSWGCFLQLHFPRTRTNFECVNNYFRYLKRAGFSHRTIIFSAAVKTRIFQMEWCTYNIITFQISLHGLFWGWELDPKDWEKNMPFVHWEEWKAGNLHVKCNLCNDQSHYARVTFFNADINWGYCVHRGVKIMKYRQVLTKYKAEVK